MIGLLTFGNTLGLRYGKLVQNGFTVAKTAALGGLIILGILLGRNAAALQGQISAIHGMREELIPWESDSL